MKESFLILVLRVLILFTGLTIAHLGVSLFLIAALGADPFNVFIQGLLRLEEQYLSLDFITHGRIHMIISFLIILVLLVVDKSYIRIGTLICMFFCSPVIDCFNFILMPLLEPFMNMPFRIFINFTGCVILAYGMTIVIISLKQAQALMIW
ncbi:MAG: hypothetical protein IJ671_04730 [Succinivibrio sp.]|jgi:hypothetical protein|nr:hypothetical protein [Succinivibrio sp.]MBR1612827.1 hypothetical protein [Succinivibrio sp.]